MQYYCLSAFCGSNTGIDYIPSSFDVLPNLLLLPLILSVSYDLFETYKTDFGMIPENLGFHLQENKTAIQG